MVHLASIPSDKQVAEKSRPLVGGLKQLNLRAIDEGDSFTTSIYGSRFAAEDLPCYEIPERHMPKEVAYRMIKDTLSLDGNPMLKCVSLAFSSIPGMKKLTLIIIIVWLVS
jgi:glutamate decarboxylase